MTRRLAPRSHCRQGSLALELVWQVKHLVASFSEHSLAERWHRNEHEVIWHASRPLKSTMRARMPNCRSSAAASVVPTHFIVPCTFLHSHALMLSAGLFQTLQKDLRIAQVPQASADHLPPYSWQREAHLPSCSAPIGSKPAVQAHSSQACRDATSGTYPQLPNRALATACI